MYIEVREQYEDKYNSLTTGDKKLVDHILYMALGWGHAHICSCCLQKYLGLPKDIKLAHRRLVISDDYLIRKHDGESVICEVGTCSNTAEYFIQSNE